MNFWIFLLQRILEARSPQLLNGEGGNILRVPGIEGFVELLEREVEAWGRY